jgi:hypothetical protein
MHEAQNHDIRIRRLNPLADFEAKECASAATQMRKNGTATRIDRNVDINLNVWFREGFG